nr:MAG TPA: hypothetical protein [Caudoviricetes sp.]
MRAGFLARLIDCLQSTLIPGQPGIFFPLPYALLRSLH